MMTEETFDVFDYNECIELGCKMASQDYCYDDEFEFCYEECFAEPGYFCPKLNKIIER